MRRIDLKYWAIILSFLSAAVGTSSDVFAQEKTRLLYFSSFPEIMQEPGEPGLAELAAAIRHETGTNPDTFFIHGGASLGPSVFGAMDNGAHMVDILNAINPSVMAIGKREFSYGFDNFILNALSATFPLVTSNLVDAATGRPIDTTYPTYLLEGEAVRIGIVALSSANSVYEYGAVQARLLESDQAIRDAAAALREEGAEAVILLADTDYDDLSPYRADGTVDVIFYTHNFGNPTSLDSQGKLFTEGALDGKIMAVDLWHPNGTPAILETEVSFLDLKGYEPAPDIAAIVNDYRARLDQLLGPSIATVTKQFNTLRVNVRSRENAFANMVTDALREQVDADAMLLNAGSIRGNLTYDAGHEISRGDIQRELPFGNKTALLKLKGAAIRSALEHGVDCGLRGDGCFTHVSNLTVRYDSRQDKGFRILSVLIGGIPLDSERVYHVAVSDFMATGNDGFEMLAGNERIYNAGTSRLIWNVAAEYVQAQTTIAPSIEGRIVDIANLNEPRQ